MIIKSAYTKSSFSKTAIAAGLEKLLNLHTYKNYTYRGGVIAKLLLAGAMLNYLSVGQGVAFADEIAVLECDPSSTDCKIKTHEYNSKIPLSNHIISKVQDINSAGSINGTYIKVGEDLKILDEKIYISADDTKKDNKFNWNAQGAVNFTYLDLKNVAKSKDDYVNEGNIYVSGQGLQIKVNNQNGNDVNVIGYKFNKN